MAEIAGVLGYSEDKDSFNKLTNKIEQAILIRIWEEGGKFFKMAIFCGS